LVPLELLDGGLEVEPGGGVLDGGDPFDGLRTAVLDDLGFSDYGIGRGE
jgi:hypothetical protein